jgi:hypothetical protein
MVTIGPANGATTTVILDTRVKGTLITKTRLTTITVSLDTEMTGTPKKDQTDGITDPTQTRALTHLTELAIGLTFLRKNLVNHIV